MGDDCVIFINRIINYYFFSLIKRRKKIEIERKCVSLIVLNIDVYHCHYAFHDRVRHHRDV